MAPIPIPLDPELARAAGIQLRKGEDAFRENSSTIILPSKDAAFLNPVQEFNRDLSTLVIRTWANRNDEQKRKKWDERRARRDAKIKAGTWTKEPPATRAGKRRKLEHANGEVSAEATNSIPDEAVKDDTPANEAEGEEASNEAHYIPFKFTVLEALAATGLRSIRYAKEIPNLRWVLANDLSSSAVAAMKRNLALNFPAGRPIEEWKPDPNNPTTSTVAATVAATKAAKAAALKSSAAPTQADSSAALTSDQVTELEEAAANGDTEANQTLVAWRRSGAQIASPPKQDADAPKSSTPAAVLAPTASTSTAPAPVLAPAPAPAPASASAPPSAPRTYSQAETDRRKALEAEGINPNCKVRPNEGDAIVLQYMHRDPLKRFHVVDLDPYGSASSFIDGAVQAVADGGLLCVTCTDLAILAGNNYPEKCFSQYGGVNVRSEFSHEAALRLVLHTIATSASRYSRYITPLLSLSIDFYLRVFVEVRTSPVETKRTASQTGLVHVCAQCQDFHPQPFGKVSESVNEKRGTTFMKYGGSPGLAAGPECKECGSRMQTAGPMWLGHIHDTDFCRRVLAELDEDPLRFHTAARIKGMVTLAANEVEDALFYFTPSKMAGLFHCENPTLKTVVSSLLQAGFQVSRSHCAPGSLKTTATRAQCFDFFRSWVAKRAPIMWSNVKAGSPTRRLMGKEEARKELLAKFVVEGEGAGAASTSASSSSAAAPAKVEGDAKGQEDAEMQNADEDAALNGSAPTGPSTTTTTTATKPTTSSAPIPHPIHQVGLSHLYGGGPPPFDFEIVDDHERADEVMQMGEKLVRYQMNPLPNWGPGKAARVTRSAGAGA
ncbi:unnamed protein product [Tilletia controversa]|nr:unnamed protein product [Tilletia controversa]CAD6921633.1 unnamed protein product [Tilletia controversa]CAD6983619.1 unnamed protein product [Tilletia controversa]